MLRQLARKTARPQVLAVQPQFRLDLFLRRAHLEVSRWDERQLHADGVGDLDRDAQLPGTGCLKRFGFLGIEDVLLILIQSSRAGTWLRRRAFLAGDQGHPETQAKVAVPKLVVVADCGPAVPRRAVPATAAVHAAEPEGGPPGSSTGEFA